MKNPFPPNVRAGLLHRMEQDDCETFSDKIRWVEEHMPADTASGLEARGHKLTRTKAPSFDFGSSQIIWRYPEGGAYLGASESRRDGAAVGF